MTDKQIQDLKDLQAEFNTASIIIEAAGGADGVKLPKFEMVAYTGAPIRQYFSNEPIIVDLDGLKIPERALPIRFGHLASYEGIGHTTEITREGNNLIARGLISRDTEAAREVVASSKNNFPWQASIGASISSVEEVKAGESASVNGESYPGPVRIIRKAELYEISFVDIGADNNTQAKVAASRNESMKENEKMGKEQADKKDSVEASKIEKTEGLTPSPGLRADAEKASIEAKRIQKIEDAARSVMASRPELGEIVADKAERAIEAGMTVAEFELEMMQQKRDIPGVGRSRSDSTITNQAVEAALCIEGGMSPGELEANFSERDLNLADRQWKGRGIGLHQALLLASQPNGYSDSTVAANPEECVRLAFAHQDRIEGSFSTVDLPTVFSNVANKYLARGFNHADDSAMKITEVGSTRDFKQVSTVAFGGDFIFKDLPAGGNIEHAEPGETSYTNQLGTKARMVAFTREQIYNDDLSAITSTSQKMGRGSKTKYNKDFWAKFEANSAFFTSGRNNRLTGGGSALDIDGLTAAETAFMNQEDPDGLPLGIMPEILLVPNELKATANQLVNSLEVRGQSGAFGVANPHAGNYKVVVSPYLTDATAWYLLADPMALASMQTLFLNNRRVPIVETARAQFDNLGIQMRGYFDFGVNLWEYRAGVANDGA